MLTTVREICLGLAEVTEKLSHGAPTFFVKRSGPRAARLTTVAFVMFHDDHHGDGRLAVWCAAAPGAQEELVAEDPEIFFRPPYVGHRGWVGVNLDRGLEPEVLREILTDAWRCVAPKRLLIEG